MCQQARARLTATWASHAAEVCRRPWKKCEFSPQKKPHSTSPGSEVLSLLSLLSPDCILCSSGDRSRRRMKKSRLRDSDMTAESSGSCWARARERGEERREEIKRMVVEIPFSNLHSFLRCLSGRPHRKTGDISVENVYTGL